MSDPSEDVAALLLVLDEPQAAVLLSGMSAGDVERVGLAMMKGGLPEAARAASVADRFLSLTDGAAAPGGGEVRGLLRSALDPPRAAAMERRLGVETAVGVPMLEWLDTATVAAALRGEHPQAVAAVVSRLQAAQAAAVVAGMADEDAAEVLVRVATMGPGGALGDVLLGEILAGGVAAASGSAGDGARSVAKVMALLDSGRARAIRAGIAGADAAAGAAIEENAVTMDDLMALPARAMQAVLRGCEGETVGLALRGMDAAGQELLLGAMPQRSAAAMRDQLAEAVPVKAADIAAAQRQLIGVLRKLRDSGEIEV